MGLPERNELRTWLNQARLLHDQAQLIPAAALVRRVQHALSERADDSSAALSSRAAYQEALLWLDFDELRAAQTAAAAAFRHAEQTQTRDDSLHEYALYLQGRILEAMDHFDEATDVYRRVSILLALDDPMSSPLLAARMIACAVKGGNEPDWPTAAQILAAHARQNVTLTPAEATLSKWIAVAARNAGAAEVAEQHLLRYLDSLTGKPREWILAGFVVCHAGLRSGGDDDQARELFSYGAWKALEAGLRRPLRVARQGLGIA